MKNAYYYLFYKFYKFGEWSPSIFPSDFTATLAIQSLELLFLLALKFYYREFIDSHDTFVLLSLSTLIPVLTLFLINYFAFLHDTTWKKYVKKFDKLPKSKNIIGTWIVVAVVVFVIGNLVLAIQIAGEMTGIQ